jgi:hypothetical protein
LRIFSLGRGRSLVIDDENLLVVHSIVREWVIVNFMVLLLTDWKEI